MMDGDDYRSERLNLVMVQKYLDLPGQNHVTQGVAGAGIGQ